MTETRLTVAQVARLIGVPLACARRWVNSGELPSQPAPRGRSRLVHRSDLEAFVAANSMPPLPPEGSPDRVDQLLAELPSGLRALLEAMFRRQWPGA